MTEKLMPCPQWTIKLANRAATETVPEDDVGYTQEKWFIARDAVLFAGQALVPTPAADEVEAVARALDAYAWSHEGMPLRRQISIDQAHAAIAALQARSAEAVGFLLTHKMTGDKELRFKAPDDLPFNRRNWDWEPVFTHPTEPASNRCKLPAEHPDDIAVDHFAAAMKAKLAQKRGEGRGGWRNRKECSAKRLSAMLRDHVGKGDPVDVANFAMMLHQRGERITAAAEPAGEGPLVWSIRRKGTHEMVWDDGGFIADSKEEAEHFAGYFVNHEAFPLYARPATPTDPERLVDAVRTIMARCEALEDEASDGLKDAKRNTHVIGYWSSQKDTAKSIRRHLHDLTRDILSAAPLKGEGE